MPCCSSMIAVLFRLLMNTFLRWAGSKRKLLPTLLDAAPPRFDRYVEPFAGSACLFFAIRPSRAVLADINEDLVNAFKALQCQVEDVVTELSRFKCNKEEYYEVRSGSTATLSRAEKAARFIYLNRFCFNGLYRTNKQGRFNVPYGGLKAGSLPSAALLRSCAETLRRADVISTSFEHTLEAARSGDFVYLDPPYSIASRRVFNEYSHFSFGKNELMCLREHLVRMDKLNIHFLVSYGLSREAMELARGFFSRQLVVQRQIAGFANNRRRSRELLITNYRLLA